MNERSNTGLLVTLLVMLLLSAGTSLSIMGGWKLYLRRQEAIDAQKGRATAILQEARRQRAIRQEKAREMQTQEQNDPTE